MTEDKVSVQYFLERKLVNKIKKISKQNGQTYSGFIKVCVEKELNKDKV